MVCLCPWKMSYENKRTTRPSRAKVGLFVLTVLYTVLYNTVCHTHLLFRPTLMEAQTSEFMSGYWLYVLNSPHFPREDRETLSTCWGRIVFSLKIYLLVNTWDIILENCFTFSSRTWMFPRSKCCILDWSSLHISSDNILQWSWLRVSLKFPVFHIFQNLISL